MVGPLVEELFSFKISTMDEEGIDECMVNYPFKLKLEGEKQQG